MALSVEKEIAYKKRMLSLGPFTYWRICANVEGMSNKCQKLYMNLWTITTMVGFRVPSGHANQFIFSRGISQLLQYI
jgi:hypothetical protein